MYFASDPAVQKLIHCAKNIESQRTSQQFHTIPSFTAQQLLPSTSPMETIVRIPAPDYDEINAANQKSALPMLTGRKRKKTAGINVSIASYIH